MILPQLNPANTFDLPLQLAGVLFLIWLGQRVIDTLLEAVISKKFFEPIFKKVSRRIKIFRTRAQPIAATFQLSFTPERDIPVSSAINRLDAGFQVSEDSSKGRITIDASHWEESGEGRVDISYTDLTEQFTIDIEVVPDTDSIRQNSAESPEELLVGSIGFTIDFKFPFNLLEDTLFNLGSLIGYLEDGINDQLSGSFSDGRFVISPVSADLTMDDWIEEEKFDISLLLAPDDNSGSEVEFFSNRAVVKSVRREIDATTVRYVRELLLNYYL